MTTIISLAARDFMVVGCDSLATASWNLVNPYDITSVYFEPNGDLKRDSTGNPLLANAKQIWEKSTSRPVNQLPSVRKLYELEPIRACLLFAGASRIGETTIRNLVEAFRVKLKQDEDETNYTMESVTNRLKDFVGEIYARELPIELSRPAMEIILSGYSTAHTEPEVWRLDFSYNSFQGQFQSNARNQLKRKEYNVVFGGQYDVIQRIVNGIDTASSVSLRLRTVEILEAYHKELMGKLQAIDPKIEIAKPNFFDEAYNIFARDSGGVTCLYPDAGSLSQQAGIDFVYFLIDMMIKSQEFSSSIPTVGGKIHIALLTKADKFRWISKESFKIENEHIPMFPNA